MKKLLALFIAVLLAASSVTVSFAAIDHLPADADVEAMKAFVKSDEFFNAEPICVSSPDEPIQICVPHYRSDSVYVYTKTNEERTFADFERFGAKNFREYGWDYTYTQSRKYLVVLNSEDLNTLSETILKLLDDPMVLYAEPVEGDTRGIDTFSEGNLKDFHIQRLLRFTNNLENCENFIQEDNVVHVIMQADSNPVLSDFEEYGAIDIRVREEEGYDSYLKIVKLTLDKHDLLNVANTVISLCKNPFVIYAEPSWSLMDDPEYADDFSSDSDDLTGLIADVNGDEKINLVDRITLTRHLAGWNAYKIIRKANSDLNGDHTVNIADRIIMTRAFAGWEDYKVLPYRNTEKPAE